MIDTCFDPMSRSRYAHSLSHFTQNRNHISFLAITETELLTIIAVLMGIIAAGIIVLITVSVRKRR